MRMDPSYRTTLTGQPHEGARTWAGTRRSSGAAWTIPRGSGADAAAGIDWVTPADAASLDDSTRRRSTAGSPTASSTPASTRSTGTSTRGRGEQAALIYDSPVTGTVRTYTYARAAGRGRPVRRRAARPRRRARATGSSSTCRWCPRPSIAMLACARIGAVHSVVFGGFAPHELAVADRRRPAEGDRVGVLRHRGASGSSSTSRCWTGRSSWPTHKPEHCVILQRPQVAAPTVGPATSTGPTPMAAAEPGGLRAGRGHRPALHPLHVRHHRQAEGRRPRQRRPRGRAALVDAERLRRRPGRGVLGRLRRRLGRRPLLHRLRAAAGRLHHGPVRGQAGGHARTRARSGGSSPSTG